MTLRVWYFCRRKNTQISQVSLGTESPMSHLRIKMTNAFSFERIYFHESLLWDLHYIRSSISQRVEQ